MSTKFCLESRFLAQMIMQGAISRDKVRQEIHKKYNTNLPKLYIFAVFEALHVMRLIIKLQGIQYGSGTFERSTVASFFVPVIFIFGMKKNQKFQRVLVPSMIWLIFKNFSQIQI